MHKSKAYPHPADHALSPMPGWAGRPAPWHALWGPLLMGLALRLLVVLAVPVQPKSDARWYLDRALELLATGRYAEQGVTTAYWPVGYPAFLAAVLSPFGEQVVVATLVNVVLGLALIVLLYHWCLQLWSNWRIASVAAWMLALYPNHIAATGLLMTEPLYAVLFAAMVVCAQAKRMPESWPLAGLIAGLATLVKAQTLLFAPLLLALLAWGGRNGRERNWQVAWRPWFSAMLVMLAVVLPWSARNATQLGAPVLVSTNGGVTLLIGNNESIHWGQKHSYVEESPLVQARNFTVADQVQADRRAWALATGWIAQHPLHFVSMMPWKACRQWCLDGDAEWWYQAGYAHYEQQSLWFRAVRIFNQLYYMVLMGLATMALGQYWLRRRRAHAKKPRGDARHLVLLLMVAYFTLLAMVFFGLARYRFHLMPFIMGYAAAQWVHWQSRRHQQQGENGV